MAKLALTVLAARKSANGMYPIFVRIAAKKEKAYIKTDYDIPDLCQWYNGKIVARSDAAMMNKRLSFELKKYNERVKEIENYDTYTATQLKLIVTQTDKIIQCASTFTDFFRKRISEFKTEGRNNIMNINKLNTMKKILFLMMAVLICFTANAQLPYLKVFKLSKQELVDGHFKYDKDKNQYVLRKSNGLNTTMNVLNAINGTTADIKPHSDDYIIILQEGESERSSMTVRFYKDESFHDIQTWLADNNIDVLETNSGKLTIQKFNYENYSVELDIERIGITAKTGRTSELSKSIDESYNVYTYSIFTEIAPFSKWHQKEAKKKAKREQKGKKKDLNDLM